MPKRGGSRVIYGGLGLLLGAGIIVVIVLAALGYFNKKGGSSGGGGKISPIPYIPGWGPSPSNPSTWYFKIKNITLMPTQCTPGSGNLAYSGLNFDTDHNIPLDKLKFATVNFSFFGNPGYFENILVNGPPATYGFKFDRRFPPPTSLQSASLTYAIEDEEYQIPIDWDMPKLSC